MVGIIYLCIDTTIAFHVYKDFFREFVLPIFTA